MKDTTLTIADLKNGINTYRQMLGDEKALNKCCVLTKRYFQSANIKEISIATFSEMILIDKEFAKMILVKLNSDIFKKRQGS